MVSLTDFFSNLFADDKGWTADPTKGMAGMISPNDRLMSLSQGLTQLGLGLTQPGTTGQRLALGVAGLGQGMSQGRRGAIQDRFISDKLAEQQRTKAAQARLVAAAKEGKIPGLGQGVPTQGAGIPGLGAGFDVADIAEAYPDQFGKAVTSSLVPKQASPTQLDQYIAARGKFQPGDPNYKLYDDAIRKLTQDAPPSAVSEYQFAKEQGFAGSFMDFQKARGEASKTNIAVNLERGPQFGQIPPGHYLAKDGDNYRLVPIPGGPAAREVQKGEEAKSEAQGQRLSAADVVTQDVQRALKLMDTATLPTTGYIGEKVSKYGGTAAHDVAALVETIEANTAFDKLAEMRKASPTGAALGNVTEKELALLGAVRGNLKQSQSDEQFRRNLIRLNNVTMDIVHGSGKGPVRIPEPAEKKTKPDPATGGQPQRRTVIQNGMRFDQDTGEYLGQVEK